MKSTQVKCTPFLKNRQSSPAIQTTLYELMETVIDIADPKDGKLVNDVTINILAIQLMIEIINHIGNTTCPGNYKPQQSIPVKRNGSNEKRDFPIISYKYILEDNKIAFERYDRNGKLISRVPWTANSVTAKA